MHSLATRHTRQRIQIYSLASQQVRWTSDYYRNGTDTIICGPKRVLRNRNWVTPMKNWIIIRDTEDNLRGCGVHLFLRQLIQTVVKSGPNNKRQQLESPTHRFCHCSTCHAMVVQEWVTKRSVSAQGQVSTIIIYFSYARHRGTSLLLLSLTLGSTPLLLDFVVVIGAAEVSDWRTF